ncbi:MAG: hypothetical protein HYV03_02400 [Deltaproteobacteria bacterium]|nr:hypothetical protein [Deltaproteobacteria bacterium]
MQPTDIFPRITIAHLADCIAHEGVVPQWVERIAANIQEQGVLKNPIIVARPDGNQPHSGGEGGTRRALPGGGATRVPVIVVDGMHRFAALRRLEIPDVVVYEIDYAAPTVLLEGWDALVFKPFSALPFLRRLAGAIGKGIQPTVAASIEAAQQAIDRRRALLAATDRRGRCHLLVSRASPTVEQLVRASELADRALDAADLRPVYVPDSLSAGDFDTTKATGLVIRPHYTKAEIIKRTLARKLFPRKSTRHLIPGRPLRVDLPLTLLRARIGLAAKNRLLDEHLRWCYASDRIRYYPESVFIFAD